MEDFLKAIPRGFSKGNHAEILEAIYGWFPKRFLRKISETILRRISQEIPRTFHNDYLDILLNETLEWFPKESIKILKRLSEGIPKEISHRVLLIFLKNPWMIFL